MACLFAVGAIVMRGAGCTFNDIVDRDFDARVERTRARPLPSGAVTVRGAIIFLLLQLLVGLLILLTFNPFTIALGVASLALVFTYPFMKRVTWWPQAFLGLTFNWGVLMGWSAVTGPAHSAGTVALCRRRCLDDRLRHHLRPSGQGG
jgi:4-hydroxybenzoate polyprenyltransferase